MIGARPVWLVMVLLFASGVARAEPQTDASIVDRLNYYFGRPNSPGAYRALAGRAVAPFEMETTGISAIDWPWSNDDPLLSRLIPGTDAKFFYRQDNCRADYALQTLRSRMAKLGQDHPYVTRWIEVQRAVFAACGAGETSAPPGELPPPLPTDDAALARLQSEDRAYQAASMAFYRGDRTDALAAFQAIAHSASAHRTAAVYMVVAIRAGSDGSVRFDSGEKPMVDEATSIAEVRAILADPGLASIHPIAQALLGWIGANRADAAARRAQVKATLAALDVADDRLAGDPNVQRQYGLARVDIDRLHMASLFADADPAWWLNGGPPADFTASQAMMDEARTNPMAAWLLFPASYVQGHPWAPFVQNGAIGWSELEAFSDARAKGTGPAAAPWKRLSLSLSRRYAAGRWRQVDDELNQAQAGDEQAVAALAFDFYHQVRTALIAPEAGSRADASQQAFAIALAHMRAFPFKTSEPYVMAQENGLQYLMTAGRIEEARRWRDALPAACCGENDLLALLAEDPAHLAAAFGLDPNQGLPLQNNFSITTLSDLARQPVFPSFLRARFARIAWGRAYALGRTIDPGLDGLTRSLNPEMTKAWAHPLGRPVRPGDHVALLDVLRSPAVNILIVDADRDTAPGPSSGDGPGLTRIDLGNHDDDNWWCRWKPGRNSRDLEKLTDDAFFGSTNMKWVDGETAFGLRARLAPAFAASYAIHAQDPGETAALAKIDCAPKRLTQGVLRWVREPAWIFSRRSGQAEALALAIKTTHYGCYSDGPHGSYSKAAWTELHRRFNNTNWAKRTKYWYNCFYGAQCPAEGDDGPGS